MRVAGVLHIFQFETRQGEEICMALQTHINDIMMKRYTKVCVGGKHYIHTRNTNPHTHTTHQQLSYPPKQHINNPNPPTQHINTSQAKAMGGSGKGGGATGANDANLGQANFGPKYEAHVADLQKQLDEHKQRYVCGGGVFMGGVGWYVHM